MEHETNSRVVTLRDLWDIFLQRIVAMVLAAAICAGGLWLVSAVTYEPRYESTATLYILRQSGEEGTGTDSDFSLALKVVNDCTYLLKSHAVVDDVIETMGLDMSYDRLYDCISTHNPDNTRILEVTVEAESPEQAKAIVDNLCRIGQERIEGAMGFQQVNFYEEGTQEQDPSNRRGLTTFALAGVAAAMVTYAVFLVMFLLDDTLRTDEDIQKALGLSILGEIPNADSAAHKKFYGYGQKPKKRGGKQ